MGSLNMARKGFSKISGIGNETVTVKVVSHTRSSQDDQTTTVSNTYSTTAKMDRGGVQDAETDAGRLGDADMVAYFPHSFTTGLSKGNYVIHDSTRYKIDRISKFSLDNGTLVYTKVFLKESSNSDVPI